MYQQQTEAVQELNIYSSWLSGRGMAFGELQFDVTRGFPNGSPHCCIETRWHEALIPDYAQDVQCNVSANTVHKEFF